MHFIYPNGYIQFAIEEALGNETLLWVTTEHTQKKRLQQAMVNETMQNLLVLVMIIELLLFVDVHGNMPFQFLFGV